MRERWAGVGGEAGGVGGLGMGESVLDERVGAAGEGMLAEWGVWRRWGREVWHGRGEAEGEEGGECECRGLRRLAGEGGVGAAVGLA